MRERQPDQEIKIKNLEVKLEAVAGIVCELSTLCGNCHAQVSFANIFYSSDLNEVECSGCHHKPLTLYLPPITHM